MQAGTSSASDSISRKTRAEQVRFFLKQNQIGIIGDLPFLLTIGYLLSQSSGYLHVALWLALVATLLVIRLVMSRAWLRGSSDFQQCEAIERSLLIIWGLYGLAWSVGPFLFMPDGNLTIQFFVLVVLALSIITTLSALGSYASAFFLLLYPVMGGQFIWFAGLGIHEHSSMIHEHSIMAGLILVFILVMTLSARRLQASHIKNISLRHENSELIDSLSSFRNAIEHATDAITVFSKEGRLEYTNPAMIELSGYERSELTEMSWNDTYSDIDQAIEFFKNGSSMIGQPWRGKLHLRRKQGDEITTMSSFSPVFSASDDGSISHCIVIQRDVSEEEMIRERMDRLQRTESLSVMAAGIAHDFNNLLTSIMGSAALIDMSTDRDREIARHCLQINEASQRAASLCEQMLAYAGQGKYQTRKMDMLGLLKGMQGGLNAIVHSKLDGRGKIVFTAGDSLPSINADESQLRQVITNLVINASEALESREQDGLIRVKLYPVELSRESLEKMHMSDKTKEGCFVCLETSDNGEGMDRSTLDRVFDPFFTTRFLGRGLGLPAVLGAVLGHKGALEIESQAGKGSVVRTYFPCVDSQGSLFQETIEGYANSIVEWSGMGTVLVVDDDSALLKVASTMIERTGFKVLCASSGSEAVDLFQENLSQITAALVDWSMPEMDGEEVARALHQMKPDVKILLSSGYSKELVMQAIASGVPVDFIQKPYSFEQLKLKLREIIDV